MSEASSQYGPPPDAAAVIREPRIITRRRCSQCGWMERRPIPHLRQGDRVLLTDKEIRADYVLIYVCEACVARKGSA